jgi:serine/threonine-protein kinase
VGTYRIIRKLARNTVAEVFLGKAAGFGGVETPVCIDRLLPESARDAGFVELFLGSVRTSATLPHTNVVRVLDTGLSDGQPCRVLEFVDGEDLRSLLEGVVARGVALGLREVCFIVQQVAEGLAHLHRARSGHRGLQPSQVWISSRGEVKLVDLGGVCRSEPRYLTPEQARGRLVEARGDVFRLGALLYELLARRPLFEDSPQVVQRIGAFDERGLEPLPGCPPSLWSVLLRALAADPEARLRSARELSDILRRFLEERQLGVDHLDIASLFARAFPGRRSLLEDMAGAAGEELSFAERTPPRPPTLLPVARTEPGKRVHAGPPPVLLSVEPPPPPDAAFEEPAVESVKPPVRPLPARLEDWHARMLDEALGLIGGSAALAPLLVRLTRRCVAHLGGGDGEETLAITAARALALAARLEEPRRFVLPTLARVRTLAGGALPEVNEVLSAVLLAGRDSASSAGCAARALLCASAFVVQVQSAEPGAAESARALSLLRQDPRITPAALEALAAELEVGAA